MLLIIFRVAKISKIPCTECTCDMMFWLNLMLVWSIILFCFKQLYENGPAEKRGWWVEESWKFIISINKLCSFRHRHRFGDGYDYDYDHDYDSSWSQCQISYNDGIVRWEQVLQLSLNYCHEVEDLECMSSQGNKIITLITDWHIVHFGLNFYFKFSAKNYLGSASVCIFQRYMHYITWCNW